MTEEEQKQIPAYSKRYLTWALALLTLSYASSFMDRTILSITQAQIKVELGLTDTELGMLSGFAFAAFYSILGLPVARLAERYSRKTIIALAMSLWSIMTALSGTARNYGELFLWRMGVGIGEAGASPPCDSLFHLYAGRCWRRPCGINSRRVDRRSFRLACCLLLVRRSRRRIGHPLPVHAFF